MQYDYPFVGSNEKRFLNSGGFIGYASDVYEMILSQGDVKDDDDDQLFYTKIFLNETTRVSGEEVERGISPLVLHLQEKWSIVLDKRADIFMNLNGAEDEVALPVTDEEVYVHNSWTDSIPTVIHGNGPAKVTSTTIVSIGKTNFSSVVFFFRKL